MRPHGEISWAATTLPRAALKLNESLHLYVILTSLITLLSRLIAGGFSYLSPPYVQKLAFLSNLQAF
jgi:hypothetical protein